MAAGGDAEDEGDVDDTSAAVDARAARRLQVAAAREAGRAPASLLGAMSLSSLRGAPSVLADADGDGDVGGFGGFGDEDAEEPRDAGSGSGEEEEEEEEGESAGGLALRLGRGSPAPQRRRGGSPLEGGASRHVRINAQPRVVIYTPKTAMSSDSEGEWSEGEGEVSEPSPPVSGDGSGSDVAGSDDGGVAGRAAAGLPSPGYGARRAARLAAAAAAPSPALTSSPLAAPFALPAIRIAIPGLPRDPAPLTIGLRIGGPLAASADLPHSGTLGSSRGWLAAGEVDVTSSSSRSGDNQADSDCGADGAVAAASPRGVSPTTMLRLKQVQAFALLQAAAGAAAVRKRAPGAPTGQPTTLASCIATVLRDAGPGSGEDSGADAAEVAARKSAIAAAAAARGDVVHEGGRRAAAGRGDEGVHGVAGSGFATSKADGGSGRSRAAAGAAHTSASGIAVSAGPTSMLHLLRLRMGGAAGALAVDDDGDGDDWAGGAGGDGVTDSSSDDGCPGAPKARAPRVGLAGAGGGDGNDSDDSMGCGASAYPVPRIARSYPTPAPAPAPAPQLAASMPVAMAALSIRASPPAPASRRLPAPSHGRPILSPPSSSLAALRLDHDSTTAGSRESAEGEGLWHDVALGKRHRDEMALPGHAASHAPSRLVVSATGIPGMASGVARRTSPGAAGGGAHRRTSPPSVPAPARVSNRDGGAPTNESDADDTCPPPLSKAARAEDDLCVHDAGDAAGADDTTGAVGVSVGVGGGGEGGGGVSAPPGSGNSRGAVTPVLSPREGSEGGGHETHSYDGSESGGGGGGTPSTAGDATPVGPMPSGALLLSMAHRGGSTAARARHRREGRGGRGGAARQTHSGSRAALHHVAEGSGSGGSSGGEGEA